MQRAGLTRTRLPWEEAIPPQTQALASFLRSLAGPRGSNLGNGDRQDFRGGSDKGKGRGRCKVGCRSKLLRCLTLFRVISNDLPYVIKG